VSALGLEVTSDSPFNSRRWKTVIVPVIVGVAVLCNPISAIGMAREGWRWPDIAVGEIFMGLAFVDFRLGSKHPQGEADEEVDRSLFTVKGVSGFAVVPALTVLGSLAFDT
jgi:hypothetical protein